MSHKKIGNIFEKLGGTLFVLTNLAGFIYYGSDSHIQYEINRHNKDLEKVAILADSNRDGQTTREEWANNVYKKLGIEFSDSSNPSRDLSISQLEKYIFDRLYLSDHK